MLAAATAGDVMKPSPLGSSFIFIKALKELITLPEPVLTSGLWSCLLILFVCAARTLFFLISNGL